VQGLTSIRSRNVVLLDCQEVGAERNFAGRGRLTRDHVRVRSLIGLGHLGGRLLLLCLALSLPTLREIRIHFRLMSLHQVVLLLGVLGRVLTFLGGGDWLGAKVACVDHAASFLAGKITALRFTIDVVTLGSICSVVVVTTLSVLCCTVYLTARVGHRLEELLIRHEELAVKLAKRLSTY